ncbi:uncharacterized protein LOC115627880 [Scaptodrosophila lebanonensis]|uniref:Uncharacterized protein LOC115627880 n=1 Tax=Drosophila lebanonensis TaxID=7225 RepID=A0A6J2TSR7_DROLE|nr:uncharacterized protein LOC115627880 [Scaptodrosophila lebanonensis]XP_030379626.1 uncharacterized protein LOC115627880 [Scaptodrosophila lebanonensis]
MPTYQYIQNYFSKLNPLAEKIARDVNDAKSAYGHVWLTLTLVEQENILNDTIIKPEIAIQYYNNASTVNGVEEAPGSTSKKAANAQKLCGVYGYDKKNLRTFIYQSVGLKTLHDENIGDYRDEHSFPFSFRTKSQINLSVLASNSNTNVIKTDNDFCKTFIVEVSTNSLSLPQSLRPIAEPVQKANAVCNAKKFPERSKDHEKSIDGTNYNDSRIFMADEQSNLLAHFGSNNTLSGSSVGSTDDETDNKEQYEENTKLLPAEVEIPKGFDFLSNW